MHLRSWLDAADLARMIHPRHWKFTTNSCERYQSFSSAGLPITHRGWYHISKLWIYYLQQLTNIADIGASFLIFFLISLRSHVSTRWCLLLNVSLLLSISGLAAAAGDEDDGTSKANLAAFNCVCSGKAKGELFCCWTCYYCEHTSTHTRRELIIDVCHRRTEALIGGNENLNRLIGDCHWRALSIINIASKHGQGSRWRMHAGQGKWPLSSPQCLPSNGKTAPRLQLSSKHHHM